MAELLAEPRYYPSGQSNAQLRTLACLDRYLMGFYSDPLQVAKNPPDKQDLYLKFYIELMSDLHLGEDEVKTLRTWYGSTYGD